MNDHGRQCDIDIGLKPRQPCRLLDKARYRLRRLNHLQQRYRPRIAVGIQVVAESGQRQSCRQMVCNHLFLALPLHFIE